MAAQDELRLASEQISRWMREHDAGVLVDNLADGATEAQLAQAEARLGSVTCR